MEFRRVRLARSTTTNPWDNLAREEYLVNLCGDDEAILYLWQNAHTVVVGRNQNPWAECRLDLLESEGGRLARRSTGGGAVYHDLGNLNYSFILPRRAYSMERQLGTVLGALRTLGISAEFSGRNDLVIGGRKFSGNAYQLTRDKGLHHGTLLFSAAMAMLSRYLNVDPEKLKTKGVASVASRVMNLRDALPGLSLDDLLDALEREFLARYKAPETLREAKEPEGEEYSSLTERYRSREWRLGRSPECAVTVRRRFPWGGMEIRFNVKNGHAADPVVFSDAMDGEMILSLGKILEGVPFRWTEMAEAVRKAFPDSPEMAETALWLEEAPISGKKEADE